MKKWMRIYLGLLTIVAIALYGCTQIQNTQHTASVKTTPESATMKSYERGIDVYEVTLNGLEWIAGGYNGKVYIFGYYDPGTGTLVLYKQARIYNDVAQYYKIQSEKQKVGRYEFEEGKFTVKSSEEVYAGTLILTKSPYCTASIVNNEGISYKPSCSS